MTVRLALTLAMVATVTACGSGAASDDNLTILSTVAPITSIVASVAGPDADVQGLIPEGSDSHTFEPRPSVARLLARGDILFMNGLQLEDPTKRLARDVRDRRMPIVELGDEAITPDEYVFDFSFPRSGGKPNPHLWTDPTLARRYAEAVRDHLVELDGTNRVTYDRNLRAFTRGVEVLDTAMKAAFGTIPAKRLLTYHDAYAYFARTYGWEVLGAVQVEDFQEPSPKEVGALIEQVRSSGVRAIFGSEVFPSPVLEQIGRETGVRYVDELRDDDLPGRPGDPAHSWFGLMRFNFVTITEALGGDASPLRAMELPTLPDQARYPQ